MSISHIDRNVGSTQLQAANPSRPPGRATARVVGQRRGRRDDLAGRRQTPGRWPRSPPRAWATRSRRRTNRDSTATLSVLVTGATGYIGDGWCPSSRPRGSGFAVWRGSRPRSHVASPTTEIVAGDLLDPGVPRSRAGGHRRGLLPGALHGARTATTVTRIAWPPAILAKRRGGLGFAGSSTSGGLAATATSRSASISSSRIETGEVLRENRACR